MSSFQFNFKTMNAYEIHKAIINTYVLKQPGDTSMFKRDERKDKRDIDVIKENHKFLWNSDETPTNWEEKLSKKYYDKLFKEYCICDLKFYKHNKVALRWRTEKEVIDGKGQFSCGHKGCTEQVRLRTWEVNFAYTEQNEKKNALVKLRLCSNCSKMLNYRTKKREIKRLSSSGSKKPSKTKHTEGNSTKETTKSSASTEEVEKVEDRNQGLWSQPQEQIEKSREEEFQEYLEDLLF